MLYRVLVVNHEIPISYMKRSVNATEQWINNASRL